MGKLHQIGNTVLRVWANDHAPPHFHAIGPDFEALIAVADLTILQGDLPRSIKRDILGWADRNRAAIEAEWNRVNPRTTIR